MYYTTRDVPLPAYLRLFPNKTVQKKGTLCIEVFLSVIFNAQIRPKTSMAYVLFAIHLQKLCITKN